jgi:RHH-type rel operon transcriptional repressor/antitoxin RelB
MLAVRLSRVVEKRLDDLAKRTGRTKSSCARQAIIENLDDMDDVYLADRSWEEVRAGGVLLTHEEMLVECGLK